MKPQPSVHLHIEELVLHGFSPGDRHRISAAMEQELARLFAEQPLPSALAKSAGTGCVDGGTFQVVHGAKPAAIGAQIAGAIHGGLNQ